ncbi:matrix Gla protein isoform X1 [Latimeria chalumnae]|uniref:matrix Gla protein isoform X1 n=1 Tax=Latimeria chalumnae TaxID=7897 RepID=UPI0003C1A611|nr:PREDICTED: matrix Gla protein-like isoform X1 [Latimeria chalumnae]|eukprot:XP_005986920.1 PREDICTED: matrix Gla protein-like isoform X1 [Latimeria chalumnae]
MRTLVLLTLIAAIAAICMCYDSNESFESSERTVNRYTPYHSYYRPRDYFNRGPFMSQRSASNFMSRGRDRGSNRRQDSYYYNEWLTERQKSPLEQKREVCEEYKPCERFARSFGIEIAYRRFFGRAK